jgi:hypothetical protein
LITLQGLLIKRLRGSNCTVFPSLLADALWSINRHVSVEIHEVARPGFLSEGVAAAQISDKRMSALQKITLNKL